jgi:uncharacterized protein with ParB-like and HNH nuclease domain
MYLKFPINKIFLTPIYKSLFMKANEVSLNNFLSQTKTQFVIPVYQRNYDWTEEQCRLLFYDIIDVGKKPGATHFIGSIVFIHEGVYTSNEVKQLVVIDGQQRLTTFSLLYLALYRFAKDNGMEEKAEEINDTFLTNKYVKQENNKMKLKQSDNNAKAFKYLLTNNNATLYSEYSKVINNYNFFRQNITSNNFETIFAGLNSLLFVEISLERGKDDPQRIFESLNSTGLELSQADLIRNYILMGLAPDAQVRVFENYWDIIEINAKDLNKEESRISDFIRDYLTFKNKKIPNKNSVYEEFKLRYADRNERFYTESLEEIKSFSLYYHKLLNPEKEVDHDIKNELSYISRLEINVSFPFIMPVYNDYANRIIDKITFLFILKLIQSYVWRRFIIGLPTNALNKIFMNLYTEVKKDEYLSSILKALLKKKGVQKFPNNKDIEIALGEKDVYNIQSKNRLYFLELLENFNNREYVNIENPDITIEHIFPQTPDSKWKEILPEDDYRIMSEKYLNTISNLTLSGNNGSLGNKTFLEKKFYNRNGNQQGYQYSRLWLNQYLKQVDTWDLKTLEERKKLLTERFFNIWEYPDIQIDEDNDTDEDYTIYNAPDPRYKKLDYFIFKDEKIITEEVSKMYYHVIDKLLEENSKAFNHPEIKQIIGLTTNQKELRTPYQIISGYYIEANIDNNSKFRKLRQLLTYFDLQDDLLINFSNREIDETDNEQSSREYWEDKASSEALNVVDGCIQMIKEKDSDLGHNYTASYIGINKKNKPTNFVIFIPKQTFVRAVITINDVNHWRNVLFENGFKSIAIGKRGRLKFRIDKDNLAFHSHKLKELFHIALVEWIE